METAVASALPAVSPPFVERRRTADRVFRAAWMFNAALTVFWLFLWLTGGTTRFFSDYSISLAGFGRVLAGVAIFYVLWGWVWYGVKRGLMRYFVGMSKEECREAFSSRMNPPGFDVATLTGKYSERRIRITDMIGRRGRFITMAMAGFFYMYANVAQDPNTPRFATGFLSENLFDSLLTNWIFLAFFYANGWLAAMFYGPQSRIMDGVLARANCLLITNLWTVFKFVMVPIGTSMATMFQPHQFAVLFAMIWGSYIFADAFAEIGGALFGKQTLRVWGLGDVNRKSIGGTVSGFVAGLALCLWVVLTNGLGGPWLVLAVVIAVSNTLFELFSPRGTDDFTMATANAAICWAFGVLIT